MGVIDEVKQRTDIVELIGEHVSLTKAGRTFRGLCPFHSEKHPSFFVYPDQQSWHCFGACNAGGDAFSFIMKKQNTGFGDALRLLAQRAGVTIPSRFEAEAKGKEKERLYQANQMAAQYFHDLLLSSPAGEKARDYVASRGLSLETITGFQLGLSPNSWDALKQYLLEREYTESELLEAGLILETEEGKTHDRFRNRLMFPIYDTRGRAIGFGARALDDSMPKYLNSPQTPIFDKSSSLYGINLAMTAIRQQDMAVMVEGYMDAITAHQNGFNNVVASMGTAVTEKHISTLKRLTKNIVLALDADTAGEEAMLRCVSYENTINAEIKVIILPEGKDPDKVIKADTRNWQRLLEEALPVIDYTFNTAASKLDLTTARDKSLAVDRLLPIIAEIKDTIRQAHYLQKLAHLVNVSERSVEAALGRIKSGRRVKEPRQEVVAHALRPLLSSPVEEYCLALLLQYPELKAQGQDLLPEYFADTQNREIFIAYMKANDIKLIKEGLDSVFHEYVDSLIAKKLPATQTEQRLAECALRLRVIFLQSLEAKKSEVLALARETGGSATEIAMLKEQGIKISTELGEVFAQKSQTRSGAKGIKK